MSSQLVPSDLLAKSKKILFITHLALGDYTYLQNFFQAFAKHFPHIEVHIWVDELRRSSKPADWVHLKKYALYDWLAACPFVAKTYDKTYSPALYQQSIQEARQQQYPLVVSLATLRPHLYAALAREISPSGFVVGMKHEPGLLALHRHWAYRKLDAALNPDARTQAGQHITGIYNGWFNSYFGMDLAAEERFPFLDVPPKWLIASQQQLLQWGFTATSDKPVRPVFINPFAKNNKRCWPLSRVVELIQAMRKLPAWANTCFVVNVVPEQMTQVRAYFATQGLERVQLFSAEENFFQLPAMLSQCSLIISVETAVMHLANAVHIPVIALMRQKNPEWAPIDEKNSTVITTLSRSDWVKAITAEQVTAVLDSVKPA
ncbi:lipopolysaccharide heptosyltransferase family protein [Paucibacter sp. B2R-40]|uniref:glycosyltransferase family 9 protein n=1 Tax=Paucibacter sp. B2R-40 TaxID=2893554 RepID=UPI0021E379EA|nr:glycosyltransferase family 9 protein [Paucibacter sp. B2R-40]MCV2354048.1 lipopolysaccharide heptosyltransferase family protein [Paucibacter sp. B2R-40]